MTYQSKYRSRMLSYGNSLKDSKVTLAINKISNTFMDSPSYQDVYINGSASTTGVWLVDNSNVKDTKDIISLKTSPIYSGDIVKWNEDLWLITVRDDMTDIYFKGVVSKCISSLKWLDTKGNIKETYFTYRNEDLTNFGVEEGKVISFGNERRHIYVPANVDTRKIQKNKRFIVDERAWKVISVDRLKKGLVYIVLQEDLINEATDRVDLGIADYTGNVANYTISILNGENFSIRAGTTLQLQAEVRNNGVIVQRDVVWSTSDESIATVNESGILSSHLNGQVTVSVKMADDESILDTTTVNVELDNVNNYSIELDSSLDVLLGSSKTFTAIVKNNLVVDPTRRVQFTLYDDDGISQPMTASMPFASDTQCILKGIKVGFCKLETRLIGSSPVQKQVFRIKIESLI